MWNDNGFEILLILCVIVILILALTRIGKKGTWNTKFILVGGNPGVSFGYEDNWRPQRRKSRDSSGELECRRVLESIFNKSFAKSRPDFLRNPVTGGLHNLELDCFNRELQLAVEYNGAQHYKYIPFFHKNKEAFRNQGYRDFMKRSMCRENNINLIEVPYTVKTKDIHDYLVKELKKLRYID